MKKQLLPMNLQMFAEGGDGNEQPKFSFDDFKTFVESNEEAQKFIQAERQAFSDKSIESWQKNNLDKIKQDTIKDYEASKKNKSPEQVALEKLQADFEAEKNLRVTSENKAFVAEQIAGLKLSDDLSESVSQFMLNNLVSADTEFTKNAVEAFTNVLGTISEKHSDELKNIEMSSAFGNKNQPQQQNNEPVKNGREQLAAGLSQLMGQ
ncbi:hypothetical protein IGI37_002083 [Enterococcus sp. AZ194]|uniref:capsid assembly scaffolding protein Gp46 family protein n=1 Tax=Enterococcus sp. AZ194 TaxID=2774629 RepID=UPI003F224AC9